MEPVLLGIDIGTSACKVAAFNRRGEVLAQSGGEYPVYHPRPGWAEQNPEEWWAAVCEAVRHIFDTHAIDPASVAGVGIDGQSWSAIPVNRDGDVLCNTPIWYDTRAADICAELSGTVGEEAIFRVSGNPLQPAYTLPKILWYKKHRPDVYRKSDKILQSNSYIAYRLTGAVTQDLSQGYGLHCFHMERGCLDEALCAEIGLDRGLLPELARCHDIVGTVTARASAQCGLPVGVPVVAGGLDAACGTLGAGVLHEGETQEQGGQAGGMSICMEECRSDPRLILGRHVVPERWLLQGGTVGGGGVLRWLGEQLFPDGGSGRFREMDTLAESVPAGSEGVLFLPYMAGERSPIWDADAKGVFYGLDFRKGRGHMIRACLEGVAYSLRHNLKTAAEAGAVVNRLRAMGGAANSRLWTQIKADVTGVPIDVPSSDTATTLGAAMLAGVAVGVWSGFDEAVAQTVRIQCGHEPNPEKANVHNDGFRAYRELYLRLKPMMENYKY